MKPEIYIWEVRGDAYTGGGIFYSIENGDKFEFGGGHPDGLIFVRQKEIELNRRGGYTVHVGVSPDGKKKTVN